ncbi:unnamed protein product [Brachionus calyciflorus]|uniref:Arrestin C-terminal-like domain-containing protein n=1 Tax=Brachionus calyciflorus TaxID=104777 RepID=A0A813P8J8_9BILA|nr:unnamed protein product [Brachionus calyciflorus]
MVHIDSLDILFDKENPVYFPGEYLNGQVSLKLSDDLKINSVRLILRGDAKVYWVKDVSSADEYKKIHNVHSNENYFHLDLNIINKETCPYLRSGYHHYPFSIKLPDNLPSTFHHDHGKIQYSIKALIDIPWGFDKEIKKPFIMMANKDLNLIQGLNEIKTVLDQKIMGFGLIKSKPIRIVFTVLKTGFVPGESVIFSVSIENESNRDVLNMKVTLIQNCKFTVNDESITDRRKLNSIEYDKRIIAKTTERWTCSSFVIPLQLCPTSDDACNLIHVSYELVLKFDSSGFSKSKKISIPIVIGTVPIRN